MAVGAAAELARHEAVFTTFCDTGSVADGTCWCKGGSATAAVGDGSWLWHELIGAPCAAQPNDRCDCTACGGKADDCPHDIAGSSSSCWQCQGVNAPQCNPPDSLKRCEVEVHGTHGSEKYYITEVCPAAHPCNRCKEMRLQRCATWSPLAIDVCGTTWSNVFERSREEAAGYVTLSCYPHTFEGERQASPSTAATLNCYSELPGDVEEFACEDWCNPSVEDHCNWCKCRGCSSMAGACANVVRRLERLTQCLHSLLSACIHGALIAFSALCAAPCR